MNMKDNKSISFMAISKGSVSTEGLEIKRFIGVGSVFVLAVNPDKKKLEELHMTQLEKEPKYVGEVEVGEDKHKVKNVRIDFIVKTDPEKCNGIDTTTKVSLFVRQEYRYSKDSSKIQVIDKYGRTAWPTIEEAKAHATVLTKKDGSVYNANIDKDYRPAYFGEEELTKFLKAYLNIPDVMKYVNNTWVMVDNPQDCEARLESIEDYFKGDFSELKDVISYQPSNKVKVLFGVRTTDDNKQYQTVYTSMFLKNHVRDYSRLDKDLQERKQQGAFANTEFIVDDLKEYKVDSTDLSQSGTGALPFPGATDSAPSPWDLSK